MSYLKDSDDHYDFVTPRQVDKRRLIARALGFNSETCPVPPHLVDMHGECHIIS
jgi:hypothetical protein